jgi:hypothetical protein
VEVRRTPRNQPAPLPELGGIPSARADTSCVSDGVHVAAFGLLLNGRLIDSPVDAIDYVITHELCHVAKPHHSRILPAPGSRVPDWRRRKERVMARLIVYTVLQRVRSAHHHR